MVDDKWSPWIKHNGGPCPIPWALWNQYEAKFLDGSVASGWCDALGFAGRKDDWWRHKGRREYCHIVAYRYLLSAAPPGWTPPGSPETAPSACVVDRSLLEEALSGLLAYTGGRGGSCCETVAKIEAALAEEKTDG